MGTLLNSQVIRSKKQMNHNNCSKGKRKHKTRNKIEKVKSSDSKIPNIKSSRKTKKIKTTKPIDAFDQITTKVNESNTEDDNSDKDDKKRVSATILPKKVSKIYFGAYSKLPKKQEVYDEEEKKQPKDLPAMKLLEAIHGISSHYANETNRQLEGLLDTSALLCLGILVEEYTKHCTTDFTEKFDCASNHV